MVIRGDFSLTKTVTRSRDCCVSVYLSVCLFVCLSLSLSLSLPACLSVCLSVSVSLSVCLSLSLSLSLLLLPPPPYAPQTLQHCIMVAFYRQSILLKFSVERHSMITGCDCIVSHAGIVLFLRVSNSFCTRLRMSFRKKCA